MLIKLMKVFEYDETGSHCRESQVAVPAWDQVEVAVRRLNKVQFPIVFFFSSPAVFEDDVPVFEIMGGDGDYVIAITDKDGNHRRVRFTPRGDRRIGVWLSDQGCEAEERFVCHDLEHVLEILGHFAASGSVAPNIDLE
jgi:hypothetical protein